MKFVDSLKFRVRKFIISLKRNYYVVPLAVVCITCVQIMVSLNAISKPIARITDSSTSSSILSYAAVFVFVVCLFSILECVAYLNYALKKDGKRPIYMLIIYLVMILCSLVLVGCIYYCNNINISEELATLNDPTALDANKDTARSYLAMGYSVRNILIWQYVLEGLSLVLVITAPIVQKQLRKIKFASVEYHG